MTGSIVRHDYGDTLGVSCGAHYRHLRKLGDHLHRWPVEGARARPERTERVRKCPCSAGHDVWEPRP